MRPQQNVPQSVVCLQELEVSTLDLSKQDSQPHGKSKSMMCAEQSCKTDSHTLNNSQTCEPACLNSGQSMSLSEVSPAKMSAKWESDAASQEQEQAYSSMPLISSIPYDLNGWYLKTSRGCSLATMAKTFKQSSSPLPNAGIWGHGCIDLGGSNIIAVPNGWDSMVERSRTITDDGLLK